MCPYFTRGCHAATGPGPRLLALENPAGIDAGQTEPVRSTAAVASANRRYGEIVGAWRSANAESCSLRAVKKPSAPITSAPARSLTKVANAVSISRSLLAWRTWSCSPRVCATTCSSFDALGPISRPKRSCVHPPTATHCFWPTRRTRSKPRSTKFNPSFRIDRSRTHRLCQSQSGEDHHGVALQRSSPLAPTKLEDLKQLELRNVTATYPFERSHTFTGTQPNSGHRDYSRLSCDVGYTQLALVPGSQQGWLRGLVKMAGIADSEMIQQHIAHFALDFFRQRLGGHLSGAPRLPAPHLPLLQGESARKIGG
jgi:hypothetical protein